MVGSGGNNFKGNNSFTVTLTADNDGGTAAVSTVALFRGTGAGSSDSLPAGITISGDYDNYTELQNALRDTGMNITEMMLESTTTTHFTGVRKIQLYERLINNLAGPIQEIRLSKYKTDSGGGVSTTLLIADKPFFSTPRTVMNVEVIKNAAITFTFYYDFVEDKKAIAAN